MQDLRDLITLHPGPGRVLPDAPLMYAFFTPSQASTLVVSLPDPERQPMPFYRRIAQIQKTYSSAWRDLASLCEIKAGDAYWPIMEKHFNNARLASEVSYHSGCVL